MKNDDREKDWNQELENLKIHVQAVTLPLLIRLILFYFIWYFVCLSAHTHTHARTHRPAVSSNRAALCSQFFPVLPGSWGSDAGCQACSASTFTHWATSLEPRSSHMHHFPHVGLSFDMWRISHAFLRLRLRKYTSISNIAARGTVETNESWNVLEPREEKRQFAAFAF